jgi:hypothetical protein
LVHTDSNDCLVLLLLDGLPLAPLACHGSQPGMHQSSSSMTGLHDHVLGLPVVMLSITSLKVVESFSKLLACEGGAATGISLTRSRSGGKFCLFLFGIQEVLSFFV